MNSLLLKAPLKAPNQIYPLDYEHIQYPMFGSIKYDGFRLLLLDPDTLVSPALKQHPNRLLSHHLRNVISAADLFGEVLDGELWSPHLTFQELQSILMSHDNPIPDHLQFYIFDAIDRDSWQHMPYVAPYDSRKARQEKYSPYTPIVEQKEIHNASEAEAFYEATISSGQEGIMLRHPSETYKHGRSTPKEGYLWKFKAFETLEGTVESCIIQQTLREGTIRTTNSLGHLERVHTKDSYEPTAMVAGFNVRLADGTLVGVKAGKGHNNDTKREWYLTQDRLLHSQVEFKYMPHGTDKKPRIGQLVRFRSPL